MFVFVFCLHTITSTLRLTSIRQKHPNSIYAWPLVSALFMGKKDTALFSLDILQDPKTRHPTVDDNHDHRQHTNISASLAATISPQRYHWAHFTHHATIMDGNLCSHMRTHFALQQTPDHRNTHILTFSSVGRSNSFGFFAILLSYILV